MLVFTHHADMTPTEIKSALAIVGGGANKLLGQHFLIDEAALQDVVRAAEVQSGDRSLEIGPGLGVLTRALIERGAYVTAIEKDVRFAEWLPQQPWARGRLTLVRGDAVSVDWNALTGEKPWKFVANLPYAITSFALRLALFNQYPPTHVSVLVQREVAERIVDPKKTSLVSLMVALATAETRIVRRVPPGAFFPPPKVDSAVLAMQTLSNQERFTKWGISPEEVMAVAKKGFAHPRKRLASNLELKPEAWEVVRAKIVDNIHARPEELRPETWVALAKSIKNQAK